MEIVSTITGIVLSLSPTKSGALKFLLHFQNICYFFNKITNNGCKRITVQKSEAMCLDTRSQSTVTGLQQAFSYCRFINIGLQPNDSSKHFILENYICTALGSITKSFILTSLNNTCTRVNVLSVNAPFLVVFDLLDKHTQKSNKVANVL